MPAPLRGLRARVARPPSVRATLARPARRAAQLARMRRCPGFSAPSCSLVVRHVAAFTPASPTDVSSMTMAYDRSPATGAGGAGINATFDALLVAALNRAVGAAEPAAGRALGRFVRTSLSQGGTSSLWASLMGEALHGRPPHVLVWEYAINDHSLAVEAAATNAGSADATMRFMVERWLRRCLAICARVDSTLSGTFDPALALPLRCQGAVLYASLPAVGAKMLLNRLVCNWSGRIRRFCE